MSRLEISDISFCETVIHNQVQGGFSTNYLFGLLTSRLYEVSKPILKKYNEYVFKPNVVHSNVVQSNNETGNVYTYQAISEDGKSQVNVVIGKAENSSFTFVSAISSTEQLPVS